MFTTFLLGVLAGVVLLFLVEVVRLSVARLRDRATYAELLAGERAARVAREHDLVGVRAQRDEAMASAGAWEQRANRLKSEAVARTATERARRGKVRRG